MSWLSITCISMRDLGGKADDTPGDRQRRQRRQHQRHQAESPATWQRQDVAEPARAGIEEHGEQDAGKQHQQAVRAVPCEDEAGDGGSRMNGGTRMRRQSAPPVSVVMTGLPPATMSPTMTGERVILCTLYRRFGHGDFRHCDSRGVRHVAIVAIFHPCRRVGCHAGGICRGMTFRRAVAWGSCSSLPYVVSTLTRRRLAERTTSGRKVHGRSASARPTRSRSSTASRRTSRSQSRYTPA